MATKAQVNEFIANVGAIALSEAKKRRTQGKKWILPGICVAQGACESAWGTSAKMVNANALFGIKCGSKWKGKFYDTRTKECYDGKNYVSITDKFRAYDSVEDSVSDYYDLITGSSRYSAACNNADAKETITAIKNGGYATSPTYIATIMSIYNKYPEIAALDAEFLGKSQSVKVEYFKRYTGSTTSIVTALKMVGAKSDYAYRKKIADANNIVCYKGTSIQNTKMLNLLKEGKLIKP